MKENQLLDKKSLRIFTIGKEIPIRFLRTQLGNLMSGKEIGKKGDKKGTKYLLTILDKKIQIVNKSSIKLSIEN